jgi:hypothetical protein
MAAKSGEKMDLHYGIKEVRSVQRGDLVRRYVSIFEDIGKPLPIKRIIVGPSTDQNRSVRHLVGVVGNKVDIVVSKTPYIPAT